MKLKNLPLKDRPREKILNYGPNQLTEVELLAAVLGIGTKSAGILQLAKKLIALIRQKKDLTLADLAQIKDLGPVKSAQVLALLELGKRLFGKKQFRLILSPRLVWQELREIRESKKEHFVVFYLDIQNQLIKKEIISIGILNANLVHPREVFEKAIINSAAQIILAHNHPSGNCAPSALDLQMTQLLVKAGKILHIEVVDHVIVAREEWLSLKKEKLI